VYIYKFQYIPFYAFACNEVDVFTCNEIENTLLGEQSKELYSRIVKYRNRNRQGRKKNYCETSNCLFVCLCVYVCIEKNVGVCLLILVPLITIVAFFSLN